MTATSPNRESGPSERLANWLAMMVIALGMAARIRGWLPGTGLFSDEQYLAVNIGFRSIAESARPLWLAQSAPIGFIGLGHLFGWQGPNERLLRLPALLAALAGLPLVWILGRRLLGPAAAMVATAAFAVAAAPIRYAFAFKPYTFDVAAALAVLLAFASIWEAPAVNRRWIWASVTVVLAMVFSSGAVFAIAGGGASLMVLAALERSRSIALRTVGLGIVAGIPLLIGLVTAQAPYLRPDSPESMYMKEFWEPYFLSTPYLSLAGHLVFLLRQLVQEPLFAGVPWIPKHPILLGGLAVLGAGLLTVARRWAAVTLLVFPVAALLAASLLGRYPISARLSLFAAPSVALLIGHAIARAIARLPSAAGVVVIGVVAAPFLVRGVRQVRTPPLVYNHGAPKWAVGAVTSGGFGIGPVYLFPPAVPGWLSYAVRWSSDRQAEVMPLIRAVDLTGSATLFRPALRFSADRPVATDAELTAELDGFRVLVGRASGMRSAQKGQREPNPGWAAGEVARLTATQAPCAILLLIDIYRPELAALTQGLSAAGWKVTKTEANDNSQVLRVCRGEAH